MTPRSIQVTPRSTTPEPEEPETDDSMDDDYDPNMDLESMDKEALEKMMAPMSTYKDTAERNKREKEKMDDLESSMVVPTLDDLSDEYAAPKEQADSLLDRDQLNDEEKLILQQRLQEDLSRRPENYNQRVSKRLEKKLLEEKQLKIARKGMFISFIPVVMGLASAALCYFKMNWGNNEWFPYVAIFGAAASLLLLIKSKQAKMFSMIIFALTVLMYVGPGLVLYALNEQMQSQPDYTVHIALAALSSALTIGAMLILIKSESVNVYYTTKFKRKE